MISIVKTNANGSKELIFVISTCDYTEIRYRFGNTPNKVHYGYWKRISENEVLLSIAGIEHKVSKPEFDSLDHFFKTTYCHGETTKKRTSRVQNSTALIISR